MNVTACLVTRGDVDMRPVLASLPDDWEVLVYDNGRGIISKRVLGTLLAKIIVGDTLPDLKVYGRYHAVKWARDDLIYVQDDDCIVSDPQAITDQWATIYEESPMLRQVGHVVCNMPPEYRADPFYAEHSLVGFGAAFHRDIVRAAFSQMFYGMVGIDREESSGWEPLIGWRDDGSIRYTLGSLAHFHRTCDIVFTYLTQRVLVDVPHENLPYAYGDDRLYRTHVGERERMLDMLKNGWPHG